MSTPVWGCLECGALSSAPNHRHRCPQCHDGLITELGGVPSPQKAQALLAWARREATVSIENVVSLGGVALGLAVGMASMGFAHGIVRVLVVLYPAVLLGLLARQLAMRVHRRARPRSRLQPVYNFAQRRAAWVGLVAWAVLPVLSIVGLKLWRDGPLHVTLKHAVGSLWVLLGGG